MIVIVGNNKKLIAKPESTDCCYYCALFNDCPLITALQNEILIPRYSSIEIKSCKLNQVITTMTATSLN